MIRRFFTHRKVTSAAGQAAGPGARRARRSRPALESLEGRTLLSFYGSEQLISINTQASENSESDNASSRNGTSVAVWDNTFSSTDHNIWAQRFDQAGQAAGAPIQVDLLAGDDSYAPHVAMDGSDRFVVTWENLNRDGTFSVMMRYYNSSGVALTGITRVSAAASTDYQPDVAASNGSFVITWAHHFSATDDDIYAERFVVSGGVPQGQGTFVVNGDGNSEARPSVAMQQNGLFDIAYERQSSPSNWDILASQYDGTGALVRGLGINTDGSIELNPSISMDGNGNAVVAYQEQVGGTYGIYANRLSTVGVVGGRITVEGSLPGLDFTNPSVALAPTGGQFVVADSHPSNVFVVDEMGANDTRLTFLSSGNGTGPAISVDGYNRLVATYTRFNTPTNHNDIFSRRDFLPSGVETLVHPTTGVFTRTDTQTDNASSPGTNGLSVSVWVNSASDGVDDIYAQRFDNLGRRLGSPIPVDTTTADSLYPHVSMDSTGRFVVTWEDLNPDGTYSVMMRYFSDSGAPLTDITRVGAPGSDDYDPDVAASNGSFVITWNHFAGANNGDIYAERFVVSGGVPQGQGIFVVNGDGNSEARPSVAMQQDGLFDIAYERQFIVGGSDWDILASEYNGTGALVHDGLGINTDGSTELNPSIAMDRSGNAVIVYDRITNGESGIYANRLTWSGVVSPRITVRDVAGVTERGASVALSPTTGAFVVAYNVGGTFTTQVAEVNGANAVTSVSGAFLGFDPSVSIDGLNRYVVTYTRFDADAAGTNSFDIFSRRSFLN